jgi:glycosyltransferase involved in cell wall biosynthesis
VTVAVIIPCYREKLERVESTVASAQATAGVDRIIVVDDGCNDAALDALDAEVIHLRETRGCSGALNAGIALLGDDDIACRLDVGDHFYPEAKARQLDVVISGQARCSSSPHFDPVAGKDWRIPDGWARRIYTDSVFVPCTNVYRVSVWREVGGHDETLRYKADWDFSMKVQAYVGWHMHPEVTCDAGMYPDGFTAQAVQDPNKRAVREECNRIVSKRGQALSHPDAYAHLFSAKWCSKRGLVPMRRP